MAYTCDIWRILLTMCSGCLLSNSRPHSTSVSASPFHFLTVAMASPVVSASPPNLLNSSPTVARGLNIRICLTAIAWASVCILAHSSFGLSWCGSQLQPREGADADSKDEAAVCPVGCGCSVGCLVDRLFGCLLVC